MGGEGRGGAGGRRKASSEADAHLADPVDVGGHPGEDRGLLEGVAAQPGAKADDAPHLPGAILRLAVQRASRVPLHQTGQVSGPRPPPEAGLGSRGGSGGGPSAFHGEGEEVVWGCLCLGWGGLGVSD